MTLDPLGPAREAGISPASAALCSMIAEGLVITPQNFEAALALIRKKGLEKEIPAVVLALRFAATGSDAAKRAILNAPKQLREDAEQILWLIEQGQEHDLILRSEINNATHEAGG